MRISDWSSDVCSSDLTAAVDVDCRANAGKRAHAHLLHREAARATPAHHPLHAAHHGFHAAPGQLAHHLFHLLELLEQAIDIGRGGAGAARTAGAALAVEQGWLAGFGWRY